MAEPANLFPVLSEALTPSPANAPANGNTARSPRAGLAAAEEVDANGDTIFRFRVTPLENADRLELDELFRQNILDILQLVKFYSNGKPLIIDSFAFLNEPDKRIRVLTGEPEC